MYEFIQYSSSYNYGEAVHIIVLSLVRCCVFINMDHFSIDLGKLKICSCYEKKLDSF